MSLPDAPTATLLYAQPAASYSNKVWAGVAILLAGLGLIVLGGCFLIGVLLANTNGFTPGSSLSPGLVGLVIVLYVLAAVCFTRAVFVLVAGLRALFRIIRS